MTTTMVIAVDIYSGALLGQLDKQLLALPLGRGRADHFRPHADIEALLQTTFGAIFTRARIDVTIVRIVAHEFLEPKVDLLVLFFKDMVIVLSYLWLQILSSKECFARIARERAVIDVHGAIAAHLAVSLLLATSTADTDGHR